MWTIQGQISPTGNRLPKISSPLMSKNLNLQRNQLLLNSYKESENRATLATKINAHKLRNGSETLKTTQNLSSPDRMATTMVSSAGTTFDRHEQPSVG